MLRERLPVVVVRCSNDQRRSVGEHLSAIATVVFLAPTQQVASIGDLGVVRAFALCVAGPDDAVDGVVRDIRQVAPRIPVIVYAVQADRRTARIVEAIKAGATHLAMWDMLELRETVRDVLDQTLLAPWCALAAESVLPRLPRPTRPTVEYCIMNVERPLRARDVAQALSLSVSTLHRLLRNAGLPPLAATISWTRLLVAAQLIARSGLSVDHVAHALRFSSGSALRNMLRRYSGLRSAALRDPRGVEQLVDLFADDRDPPFPVTLAV